MQSQNYEIKSQNFAIKVIIIGYKSEYTMNLYESIKHWLHNNSDLLTHKNSFSFLFIFYLLTDQFKMCVQAGLVWKPVLV